MKLTYKIPEDYMTNKNCDQWALYEEPGSSESANLCNGGEWEGEHYSPCSQRLSCRVATSRNDSTGRYSSPQGNTGRRVLASTGGIGRPGRPLPVVQERQERQVLNRHAGTPLKPLNGASNSYREMVARKQQENERARKQRQQEHRESEVLPSRHRAQGDHVASATSPVFMPDEEDGIFSRWGKNIAQGAIHAAGQQVADYTRHVDIFGTKVRNRLNRSEE